KDLGAQRSGADGRGRHTSGRNLSGLHRQCPSEFRERGKWLPVRAAFGLYKALRAQPALGNPAAQFVRADWPVFLLVSADDLIHSRRAQWNALLTSGFNSTTTAQIPIGRPITQHGEKQGIIAMMLTAIAK